MDIRLNGVHSKYALACNMHELKCWSSIYRERERERDKTTLTLKLESVWCTLFHSILYEKTLLRMESLQSAINSEIQKFQAHYMMNTFSYSEIATEHNVHLRNIGCSNSGLLIEENESLFLCRSNLIFIFLHFVVYWNVRVLMRFTKLYHISNQSIQWA